MSRSVVAALLERLSSRDLAILDDIERFRLLTTQQIQQLHFVENRTRLAAARACNRSLARLRQLGVVTCLDRRIGGVRSGSSGLVWYLTASGARLQHSRRGEALTRRRLGEPSHHFVAHTLAVAEVAVDTITAARAGRFELVDLQAEPANWQPSLTSSGVATWLKPDLLVVTASGAYENHWFVEIDLATEHLPVVRRQQAAYRQHRASGRYQAIHGVYPVILWLVPNQGRESAVRRALGANTANSDVQVATPADYLTVLSG